MNNMHNPKFARAVACFRMEVLMSQRLFHELERMRNMYGVAGNALSGGLFPHWPQHEKQRIRRLNRAVNRLSDAGFQARPKRVQMETMRMLRLMMTTQVIREQHGSA